MGLQVRRGVGSYPEAHHSSSSKLNHLRISCHNTPHFESAFGERTQESIPHLVASVEALWLVNAALPATFFEKLPALRYLHFDGVTLASETDLVHSPPPTFPSDTEIIIDNMMLEKIHDLYQRSRQPLPGYTILTVPFASFLFTTTKVHLSDMLDGSRDTLTHLELCIRDEDPQKNLSHLGSLKSVIFNVTCTKNWQRDQQVSDDIESYLARATSLFNSTSSVSNLVDMGIIVFSTTSIWERDLDKRDCTILALKNAVGDLDSHRLLAQHPKLKKVKLKISLPIAPFLGTKPADEMEREKRVTKFIQGCIKEVLAEGDHPLVYIVQVDFTVGGM
ncbi:hypothetical protein CPB83DRAFT_862920 [Crepidotus variabilis]|uniref:Uncharacterized protein n=1 Tax=Crepidotus variabilis TaxID=179855 RepID=A0A9P6E6L2_9AGAR|nr:hypothetical protein CPB83DRAFT_862920 [Crepidotus variabilis]